MSKKSLPFNDLQSWEQQVVEADHIYAQVKEALEKAGRELPKTPRLPDARLIVKNISGSNRYLLNPKNHAKGVPETIFTFAAKNAAMVMLKGEALHEQLENAQTLVQKFNLARYGLTKRFIQALGTDQTSDFIDEAYGPASFDEQSSNLEPLDWQRTDGSEFHLEPVLTKGCAYGPRATKSESVFRSEFVLRIKGTNTVGECAENEGMCIAISEDWKTKEISTRPIVPSVAKEFYGVHYPNIPTVSVYPDGTVLDINLTDGSTISLRPNISESKKKVETKAPIQH